MIAGWWQFQHDTSSRTPLGHGLDQVFEARHRGQPPFVSIAASTACPSFVRRSPRRIALDETSHDHGRHRRTRDAGVLPIRVAGDAEQQGRAPGCSALGPRLPWASPVACSCCRRSTSQECPRPRAPGRLDKISSGRCSRSHLAAPRRGPPRQIFGLRKQDRQAGPSRATSLSPFVETVMVYSKHDQDQLQQEIFDSLPVTRIYGRRPDDATAAQRPA
jgi:hypothetical protein